jgi:hypothetical protein
VRCAGVAGGIPGTIKPARSGFADRANDGHLPPSFPSGAAMRRATTVSIF